MSQVLSNLLRDGTGWRNESLYNSGVTNFSDIMLYEVTCLGNSDILATCIKAILKAYPKIEDYKKATNYYVVRIDKRERARLCRTMNCDAKELWVWFIHFYTLFVEWKKVAGEGFEIELDNLVKGDKGINNYIRAKYKGILTLNTLMCWIYENIHMIMKLYSNEPFQALWLTSKHAVENFYDGKDAVLSQYKIPKVHFVASDLNSDGVLFVTPMRFEAPKKWYHGELIEG